MASRALLHCEAPSRANIKHARLGAIFLYALLVADTLTHRASARAILPVCTLVYTRAGRPGAAVVQGRSV
jgi:hypothetical protein